MNVTEVYNGDEDDFTIEVLSLNDEVVDTWPETKEDKEYAG